MDARGHYPSYYFAGRPTITGSPMLVHYGAAFTVDTPNAPFITEVVLIRPGAVTHGFNMSQRFIGCEITVSVLCPGAGVSFENRFGSWQPDRVFYRLTGTTYSLQRPGPRLGCS
jgi:Domain of unknown function (DUF1929)